jgi:hypothetical protein
MTYNLFDCRIIPTEVCNENTSTSEDMKMVSCSTQTCQEVEHQREQLGALKQEGWCNECVGLEERCNALTEENKDLQRRIELLELAHRQFEHTLSDFTHLGREVEKYKADVEERIAVLAYENQSLREQVEQLGATPGIINMTKDLAERVNAVDNHMQLETMNMKSNMAKMGEKFDRYVEKEMNQENHVHALRDTSASGSKDVDKIEQPLQQADITAANLQCSLETGQSDMNMSVIEDETESDCESYEQSDTIIIFKEDETESNSIHDGSPQNSSYKSILKKKPVVKPTRSQDSSNTYTSAGSEPEKNNATIKTRRHITFATANETFFFDYGLSMAEEEPEVRFTRAPSPPPSYYESYEQSDTNMIFIEDETESDSESHEQSDMNMTVIEDETESDSESHEQYDMIIIVIEDETESNSIRDGSSQNSRSKSILKKKPVVKPTRSPSPPPSYYESHEQSDTNMIFMEDETEPDA